MMEMMRGIKLVVIGISVFCVLVCASGVVSAATWYVDDDGGQDFTKIQAAVNAASDGDTIYVYAGYYNK